MSASFQFNTDLLVDENDQRVALMAYPNVYFALDDSELRDAFLSFDRDANATKKKSRAIGVTAVVLVTIALMAAASAPIHHDLHAPWSQIIVALGAICGIVGGAIGVFGLMFAEWKQRWLEKRYLAERLRQLHFQTLVAWAPEILKAAETGDRDEFLRARSARLSRFKQLHVGPVASKLAELGKEEGAEDFWLAPARGDLASVAGAKHFAEFVQALEDLRVTHQLNYAELKLNAEALPLGASPVRQVAVFSGVAFWAVVTLLLLDILALLGAFSHSAFGTYVHVAALWLAIVALAMRALEEGFQSRGEVQRFRQLGSSLRLIRRRIRHADDRAEKLRGFREMEELAFEDMANFLEGNAEARFIM